LTEVGFLADVVCFGEVGFSVGVECLNGVVCPGGVVRLTDVVVIDEIVSSILVTPIGFAVTKSAIADNMKRDLKGGIRIL
jgi:hypothetical protein